jgi:hypothetical protein
MKTLEQLLTTGVRRLTPPAAKPLLPKVKVQIGPSFPGWVLRVAAAAVVAVTSLLALWQTGLLENQLFTTASAHQGSQLTLSGQALVFTLFLVLLLVIALIRWPSNWQCLVAITLIIVLVLAGSASMWWVLLHVVLCYAALRLTIMAAAIPWEAQVEWAVLKADLPRDLLVIGATLAIGILGLLATGQHLWGLLVGALVTLGLVWWLRRRP